MNLTKPLCRVASFFYSILLRSRFLSPPQRSRTFAPPSDRDERYIEHIYVINLDRATARWTDITRELNHVLDTSKGVLTKLATRFSAIDARDITEECAVNDNVYPFYTLADQLYVEPQPNALPDKFELDRPIRMSMAEIAVAQSHIHIWRRIASGQHAYALILEDDICFVRRFGVLLDSAWSEMTEVDQEAPQFDILYLSYKEVKHGAKKVFLSNNVFRPERGLWYFSGYVLSKKGARKLLDLLPCSGPIDLWINHQFHQLDVRAIRRSIIDQRRDLNSSNSYSILPSLTKIGVIDSEGAALFHERPKVQPVFAFSVAGAGASSLAMALSMLGYRCCSDLDKLPLSELESLLTESADRVFNAYVNVGCLSEHVEALIARYPQAKFIITTNMRVLNDAYEHSLLGRLEGADVLLLDDNEVRKWHVICEHLTCAPPVCPYPEVEDLGQQRLLDQDFNQTLSNVEKCLKRDASPWIVKPSATWQGIFTRKVASQTHRDQMHEIFTDSLEWINPERWYFRDDTFTGNLALFRPENIRSHAGLGITLTVMRESLGVREFSAAAISSRHKYLFGRFEIAMRATKTPGLVTGFFLHRDSPRQEIDIEIVGNRSDHLLVNVFYNPGGEGARFDYGYRGTPITIPLGFDAADAIHNYAIEWDLSEIRWFVDGCLVHRRGVWDPTPIPHLPMTLHVNCWPTRSRELAGRIRRRGLPNAAVIASIAVDAKVVNAYA